MTKLVFKQFCLKSRLPCLLIFVSFVLGYSTRYLLYRAGVNYIFETRLKNSHYQFINPLLECDNSILTSNNELDGLKSLLKKYIDKQISDKKIDYAAFYFRDLNNGPWTGIKEDTLFSPSSLIKVPLMMTYFKIAETSPEILDEELVNTTTFNPNRQNIQPSVTLAPNQKYTVIELIKRMIIYSDNDAYDLLNQHIGGQEVLDTYNNLGVDISKGQTDPNGDILSVKSYASFFRILFNASYLDKEYSELALTILSQSKFTQGIVAGVAPDIIVAHKFGERQYLDTGEKELHDCGIVYLTKNPYLLCTMTQGNNFENLTDTIKTISTKTYNYVTSKN
jgi:beta-lactamase class A